MSGLMKPIKISYCYVREDKMLRDRLEKHFEPLRYSGKIITWYDRKIPPQVSDEDKIDIHLTTSDIILLLISPHLLLSGYCSNTEMKQILEMHKAENIWVICIILRPMDWKNLDWEKTLIGELPFLPISGKPVTKWRTRSKAFKEIVEGVHELITTRLAEKVEKAYSDEAIADIKHDFFSFKELLLTSELTVKIDISQQGTLLAPPRTFGTLLKHFRYAASLSQESLARRLACSVDYVSMMERGKRIPSSSILTHLNSALWLSEQEFDLLIKAAELIRKYSKSSQMEK
jgi:Helix-turn-helix domain